MEEIDLSKEIQVILSNDNFSDEIKSKEEIEILLEKKFNNNDIQLNQNEWRKHIPINKLLMGFSISGGCFIFSNDKFCVSSGIKKRTKVFDIRDFDKVKVVRGGLFSDNIELDGIVIGKFNRRSIDHWNRIHSEINSIFKSYSGDSLVEGKKKLKLNKEGNRKDELSLSDKLLDFYNLNYYKESIRDWSETFKHKLGSKKYFLKYKIINNGFDTETDHTSHNQENFLFSIDKDKVFYYKKFLLCKSKNDSLTYFKVDYSDINNIVVDLIPFKFGSEEKLNEYLKLKKIEKSSLSKPFYKFLKNGVESIEMELSYREIFIQLDSIIRKHTNRLILEEEDKRLKELQVSQTNVLSELDKDGNGEVDVVEGNDFNTLLKKHQKSIVEVDRNYIQQFVKVSSYLKTKKGNIQSIFNSIKDTPNQEVLNEYVEILKGEIHTYNLILFNSLNMIVSLVEDDMITFYEIHEMFDEINMFDSKHEKDVSQKLTNIGDGLESLMYKIRDMGNQISNSIEQLSYVTEQSNQQLQGQLSGIHSTLKVGNLISVINTYQNYKINKNTKSLRG